MGAKPLSVSIGTKIEIELHLTDGGVDRLFLDVVHDEYADYLAGFLGIGTQLGCALAGHAPGDVIIYQQGDISSAKLITVERSTRKPDLEKKRIREENLRKAVERSGKTDAMIFASSFSGKWGDYDPKSIPNEDDTSKPADT